MWRSALGGPMPQPSPRPEAPLSGRMHQDPDVVPPAPGRQDPPRIQAEITVGGDLSGQLAIGENIVQLRIDNLHGNIVQQVPAAPNVRRRPSPLHLVPPRPPRFVDRAEELSLLLACAAEHQPVCVHGPRGVGKSTLLRAFANAPPRGGAGGVAHLPAAGLRTDDLAQSLFDLFYETDAPYKPSRGELAHRLRALDAVVALDDVGLDPDAAAGITELLTGSAVVMASTSAVLDRSVPLTGLPEEDAIGLVAASAGEGGWSDEGRARAAAFVEGRDGRPLSLMQLAAAMRAGASIDAGPAATAEAVLAALDDDHAGIVRMLAVIPTAALDDRQLSLLLHRDVTPAELEILEVRGVVQTAARGGGARRWSIADGMAEAVAASWDLEEARGRLYDIGLRWALRAGQPPMASMAEADAIRAVAGDAAARGRHDLALRLLRGVEPVYAASGMWAAWGDSLDALMDAARITGDRRALAFGLHQAGTRLLCLGEPMAGAALLERARDLRRDLGDRTGEAVTRHNLALATAGRPVPPWWRRPAGRWVLRVLALAAAAAVVVGGGRALGLWDIGDDRQQDGQPQDGSGSEQEGDGDVAPAVLRVPDVVGRSRSDAVQAIEDAGLAVAVDERYRSDTEPGTVFDQDPDAGSEVEAGETVTLTVARGIRLPDVVGATTENALMVLDDLPLEVTIVYVAADGVDAGTVVAQDPAAGSVVDVDTGLTLDVAGVRMPDAAGVDLQAALEKLRFLGLPATAEPREAVARVGTVLEQFPEADAIVAPGTEVELVWAQVRIPTDLVGMDVEDAADRLRALGLTVTRSGVYAADDDEVGKVIDVTVEAPYRPGDLVDRPVEVQLSWGDPDVIG